MTNKLSPKGLALASAILFAGSWFLLMGFSLLTGIGESFVNLIGLFDPLFDYSWLGLLITTAECFVFSFVFGWVFGWLYNKLT